MNEIWNPIHGYENLYQVSNLGRIKSLLRYNRKNDKILKTISNWSGYQRVTLCKNKKHKIFSVHRLVAISFIYPYHGETVNHKNGNKKDNHVNNLEWLTSSENMKHAFSVGLNHYGEKHGKSKITTKIASEIKKNIFLPTKILCKKYKITHSIIYGIRNGKTWRSA